MYIVCVWLACNAECRIESATTVYVCVRRLLLYGTEAALKKIPKWEIIKLVVGFIIFVNGVCVYAYGISVWAENYCKMFGIVTTARRYVVLFSVVWPVRIWFMATQLRKLTLNVYI